MAYLNQDHGIQAGTGVESTDPWANFSFLFSAMRKGFSVAVECRTGYHFHRWVRPVGLAESMDKLVVLLLGLVFTTSAFSVVIEQYGPFDVYFYDEDEIYGSITNTQAWTVEQKADVAAAVNAWDSVITNTPGRQIKMHVFWNDFSGNILGGSSSTVLYDGGQRWQSGEFVWKEEDDPANYGIDIDADTLIRYDVDAAGQAWNFGSDSPTAAQIDFRSVITHEIGHSLGFSSSYNVNTDLFGFVGYDLSSEAMYEGITAWDMNLIDSVGNVPGVATNGIPGNFDELDNPVYFYGANATNLYGGLVPIYAPASWQPGSSLSHLDETELGSALMSPYIGNGDVVRAPTDLEVAMMADMDWKVIPEPATIVILVGFGAAVYAIRRFFAV
ncbi:MAG: hypothetical protein K9M45_08755 [Kiritimatiellales bacterium]|nr:hypothetical protein [Kiritimatiellales bacterium]